MQVIGSLSSASSMPVLNPAVVMAKPSSAKVATASNVTTTSSTSATTTSATSTPAPAKAAPARSGGGGGGGASVSSEEEELVTSYTTTVAGKSYSGSVEKSGSQYTASVGNLAGATASGSSAAAAENNLTVKIDELV